MKKRNIIAGVIVAIIALGALYLAYNKKNDAFLIRNELDNLTIEQIIEKHEDLIGETKFTASVLGDKVVFMDAEEEYEIKLPKDKYYLSVAPYIQNTHPCFNHNLATCKGELANSEFKVIVKDGDEVIYDDKVQSYNNGFFGLWLPKGKTVSVYIEKDGKTALASVDTNTESPTCLTTMKLQ